MLKREWLVLPLALLQGCTCGQGSPADGPARGAGETRDAAAMRDGAADVTGDWSGRPFQARAALAQVHDKWMTITVLNREADCLQRRLRETDMALQLTVPTGPAGDFFVGQPMAITVKLSGAGGVSSVPASHVTAKLEQLDLQLKGRVRGSISFAWRTGKEADAPAYSAAGAFEALVCETQPTVPSLPMLEQGAPVSGMVSGQQRAFPSFLAFVQRERDGREVVRLKGYSRKDINCYSDRPNTPYLFGPEFGPGTDGKYFVGGPMPADWIMQMVDNKYSERSVHAGEGAGVLQLHEVRTGRNGVVRGRMMAVTVGEDDEDWRYEVAGTFEAPICEVPIGIIAP
jgi:hypothetical protein